MRLRRLTLTNVAGVRSAELVVPDHGVSVVLAPNETGKSTLLRAYRLLLSRAGHTSRTQEVRSLQPIGEDVGSTISAELVLGGDTLHIDRTYNTRPASSLTVRGTTTVTRTGKEADDLLRALLGDAVDAHLADLLLFTQGRTLDPLPGATSPTVLTALRERDTGVDEHGGDALLEALRGRVSQAFHRRNDTLIGPLRKLADQVEDAEAQRDRLAAQIASLAGDDQPTDTAATIAELTTRAATLQERISRAVRSESALRARKLLAATSEQLRVRTAQRAAIEPLAQEASDAAQRLAATEEQQAALQQRVAALEAQAASTVRTRTERLATAAQAEANLLAALTRTATELQDALDQDPVRTEHLTQARDHEHAIALADAALRGGAWEVHATLDRPLTITVDDAPIELEAGDTLHRSVTASLLLSDGGTSVHVQADAQRREAVTEAATLRAALAALLRDVGVETVDVLAARVQARTERHDRRSAVTTMRTTLLEQPVTEPLPEPDVPSDTPLDVLTDRHARAREALAQPLDDAAQELVAASAEQALLEDTHTRQVEELARSTARHKDAIDALDAACAAQSDEDLQRDVAAAQAAADAFDAVTDTTDDEDPVALTAELEAVSLALETAKDQARDRDARRSSVDALRPTLDTLTESAAALRATFDRDLREAEAARRLLVRLETARAAQGDRYREPLEQRIGELLTRLYDVPCTVELDDGLRIVHRSEADGRMIPWEQLSGGAREQAAVVTGLALAELAGDGGVPFWIDDAIVFTDDDRVEALKRLLADTTAQVIVLTCRREVADGLPQATFTVSG